MNAPQPTDLVQVQLQRQHLLEMESILRRFLADRHEHETAEDELERQAVARREAILCVASVVGFLTPEIQRLLGEEYAAGEAATALSEERELEFSDLKPERAGAGHPLADLERAAP